MPGRLHFGLFALLLWACSGHNNQSVVYYISATGSDDNNGTKGKPLATIERVNKLVLLEGDSLLFEGGVTFQGNVNLSFNGSQSRPVFIGSYGQGNATINGGAREAIVLKCNYFMLNRINAVGSGRKTGNTTNGISLINCAHGSVVKISVTGFQKSGLDLYRCTDINVNKVHAFDNGFAGINVGGATRGDSKNIRIEDCLAENNPGDPTNQGNHSGNGILVGMSDGVIISHCVATNNGWDMPRIGNGPVGIWTYESNNVLIEYCISYRNKTAKGAKDGGGFDLDGGVTNSIIQYCLSYENEGAGYGIFQYAGASVWKNNLLRYNLSINDATATEGSGGVFIWNGSNDATQFSNCNIYNNLIYSSHAPAIQFETASLNSDFFVRNNVFIGLGEIVHGPSSGEKFTGNAWWGATTFRGFTDLKTWANVTGQEKAGNALAGLQIDPQLKGGLTTNLTDPYQLPTLTNYQLQSTSPLQKAGTDITELFGLPAADTDFFGILIPRGKKPGIGISEMQ